MGWTINSGKMAMCGIAFLTLFFSYGTLEKLTTQIFEQLVFFKL